MARKAADQLGVEAWFLVEKFRHGLLEYERGLKKGERATEAYKKKVEAASEKASKSVVKSIRSMRSSWMMGAAAVAAFAGAVVKGYQTMEEAARARGMRAALISMGKFYGVNIGGLVAELMEVADGTISTSQAVEVANRAMMAGGKAFATEIPRLFEIARAAAVATGKDVMWVFETLTRGIAKGSPLLIDNAEIYMTIGSALREYAESLGKATTELTRQEKTQATLNAVLDQGGKLVDAIGEEATEAVRPFAGLSAAITDLKDATAAAVTASAPLGDTLDFIRGGVDFLTQTIIASIAVWSGMAAVAKAVIDVFRGVIDVNTDLSVVFADAVRPVLEEGAEAMGWFKDESANAAVVTEELGDALEDTGDALEKYEKKIEALRQKTIQRLVDMQETTSQKLEDMAIKRMRRLEDIERKGARRRADIYRKFNQRMAEINRTTTKEQEDLRYDHQQTMLDLERAYQDRMRDIERAYRESMYDAIAARDATAALRAMRTREQDIADAQRDRERGREDAQREYEKSKEDLEASLEEQREAARRMRDEELAALERNLRQQREDLEASLRRQAEDLDLHNKRKLEKMRAQYESEYWAAWAAYTGQENLYATHLENMATLWRAFQAGMWLPTGIGKPEGDGTGPIEFAEGGAAVVSSPTQITVGEGRYPELVIAQPLKPIPVATPSPVRHTVGGAVRHDVDAIISQGLAGFEGRLGAAVRNALLEVTR